MEELKNWLQKQQQEGNYRALRPVNRLEHGQLAPAGTSVSSSPLFDFSSNDYLALSVHPSVISTSRHFLERFGAGSGAARLMSGDLEIHHQLEEKIAHLKGMESALTFGSGYLANVGIIPALAGRNDVIFCDRLNHASIYDGCLVSGARLVRFSHNDPDHLERQLKKYRGNRKALIVVESIYSMDGDRCPLQDVALLKKRFDCTLMVDEAHATGLFGARGGGVIEEDGLTEDVDIAMGTFGKALGSYGAYAACSDEMKRYLVNRARSFIYTTALPPAVIGASLAAVDLVGDEPGLREELFRKVSLFKECLTSGGWRNTGPSQIVPILVGDSRTALEIAAELQENTIFATAVRPPTVPKNTARLRFSITRHLSEETVKKAAEVLLDILSRRSVSVLPK